MGGAGRTCNVILGDASLRLCFPKELKYILIIWFHKVQRCFPVFIPYAVPKSQVAVTVVGG